MNRASLRVVKPKFGSSYSLKHYLEANSNDKVAFWHFHPEIELVYVKGGNGVRHIGNHISYYKDGDLVLIGSNLAHDGFTDRLTGNESEIVLQFKPDFLSKQFMDLPEMQNIKQLFDRSSNGLVFHGNTKDEIGAELETMSQLKPFEGLLTLFRILNRLSTTKEVNVLNAAEFTLQSSKEDNNRIAELFQYIKDHYSHTIHLQEIADVANMTVPSFCRYFKKTTEKTFTQFVNEYRIIEACKLLTEEPYSISDISFRVGFNSTAHFNKNFKALTGNSPRAYRNEVNIYHQ